MSRIWRGLTMSRFRTFPPHLRPTRSTSQSLIGNHIIYRTLSTPVSGKIFCTQTQDKCIVNNKSFSRTVYHIERCNISTTPNYRSPDYSPLYNQNRSTLKYIVAIAVFVVGLSYAAVPLYRVFCQASGYGGTVTMTEASEKVEKMEAVREREITIKFNADTSAAMRWQFKPQQREIKVVLGETALAFYTARNTSDKAITGMATYNVVPFEAGLYFNKIQCFCFEEQRLNPNEQVDMPVFFYIDPEFNDDPAVAKVDTITLSYTFFEAKEGENLQLPSI